LSIHRRTQSCTNAKADCHPNSHANRNVVNGCPKSSANGYSEHQADANETVAGAPGLLVVLITHSLTQELK
jgi:hypothetical protein